MPGKQSGPSGKCWPDRLIGDMPNIYLYAANNPSEASLAKRRSNAITVSHLTPPLDELAALLKDQAEAVDLDGSNPDKLWTMLLETESALITDGLHVVGAPTDAKTRKAHLDVMHHADNAARARADNLLQSNAEMDGLLHALDGRYTRPVAGGDIIRNPEILPTGRNIHAFDPFRMPTSFAMSEGAKQAQILLDTHQTLPRHAST